MQHFLLSHNSMHLNNEGCGEHHQTMSGWAQWGSRCWCEVFRLSSATI